jgi:hypothetical protein
LTLLDNGIEEPPKHLQAVPQADLAETGMIGQRLIQIVPEIPSDAQSIRDLTHEQAFGADIFKKHHELQLEKYDRINGWSSNSRIALAH